MINNEKLVSIIIPIYNVEKFIEIGVRSVMNQDYRNIEIILVDDGSPDNSLEIIERLAKEDSRIKVFHKENGGVSSARNLGLKVMNGEYVTFIDGDDWVDKNYVSYLVQLIESQNCDIGINKSNYSKKIEKSNELMYTRKSEVIIEWLYRGDVFVAVWNKIYSTKLLKDNLIFFDENIWFGEGMLFNIDCLQYTEEVAVGQKCVYHQVENQESAMRKFNLNSHICGIKSLDIQKEHWRKKNKRIERAWQYHRRTFNRYILCGLASNNLEIKYKSYFDKCAYNLKHNLKYSILVKSPLKDKIWYICAFINPYMMARIAKKKNKKNK